MKRTAKRPKFLSLFLQDLKEEVETRGAVALLPTWPLVMFSFGCIAAYFVPESFFVDDNWDISTAVYGAILTFNGLILALSWQAFSRIQASICTPGFSDFLSRKGLLEGYFFLIDYIQLAQVAAIAAAAAGLISVLVPSLWLVTDKAILALALASSGYAMRQGMGAVTLMHDLVWAHASYDAEPAPGNVSQFPASGRNAV